MFLRNYWYVAGWSSEVSEKPLARTLLGESVVLFRTPDGTERAHRPVCAPAHAAVQRTDGRRHARVRLPRPRLCRFGRCVHSRAGQPPNGIAVRSFPAFERYGAVWLWMGDAEKADPKISGRRSAESGGGHHFYFHVKANYLLLNDNLSDLLHQAYLHNPSFGGDANPLGEFAPEMQARGRPHAGALGLEECQSAGHLRGDGKNRRPVGRMELIRV